MTLTEEPIQFVKLSGSGNDHICIDNRDGRFDPLLADPGRVGKFARMLCRRSLGIGGDGVIFACKPELSNVADLGARFFEADGSEAALCGNGTACFTRWAFDEAFVGDTTIHILTPAGIVRAERGKHGYVVVCIPSPQDMRQNLSLGVEGFAMSCDYVVTGVPHLVTYVEDVNDIDIARLGPAIRHHRRFEPDGVNANFVQVLDEGEIALRTWEFGVEGETLACGTGSAASAILTTLRNDWPAEYRTHTKPVTVHARSGDLLRVYFRRNEDGTVTDVCLETVVRFLFRGTIADDLAREAVAT